MIIITLMKKHLLLSALAFLGLFASEAFAQSAPKHRLAKLPYTLDALAPKMSRETLEFHYGKHYQTYLDNLNALILGTPYRLVRPVQGPIHESRSGTFRFGLGVAGDRPGG